MKMDVIKDKILDIKEKIVSLSKKQKIIGGVVIGVIILLLIILIIKLNKKDVEPISYNTNPGVVSVKYLNGLKFDNTSLKIVGDTSTLTTTVTNSTKKDIKVRLISISAKDSNGKVVTELSGYVGGVIPKKGSRVISSSIDMNLKDIDSIDYYLEK